MGLSLGAYLSHPVTDKHSSDEENSKMSYGVSSMQGWRETQEDAHNCILDFDGDTSFFAVYDGHGGNEVSEYTSQHLPNFLKENEYYKKGDYEKALKDSFVKFDCTLKEPEVVKILQKLAKYNDGNDEAESESDEDNLGNLKAEAKMSIEEVMAKYVSCHKEKKQNNSEAAQSSDKSSIKDSVRFSEVSSNETECSSSKSNKSFNESDSEVSSSSSSCAVSRKSLSEKYNANGKLCKSMLDSTSNGSEEVNNSCSSQVDRLTAPESCDSGVGTSKTESDCGFKSPPENDESTPSSGSSPPKKSSCNGKIDDNKAVDDAISSSVENGEAEGSKGKGKGKALVKHHPKTKEDKMEESSEKLFQKFIHSESNEEMSESDSDDVTFNGPESRSEDDDDDDDQMEEGDGEDDDEDDDDDDDDEDEDEDDDEDDDSEQYENEMDRCFMEPGSESGCTALVALIKGKKLYVANAGDCRCVVSKNGEAVEMSFDHKPENDIELKRIEKAGGRVNAGRVNDGLNLSRALGDHVYKRTPDLPPEEQMISPLPDIEVLDLEPDVEFMVLACDGIWNSMSSKEVVDFVRPRLLEKPDNLSKICEQLFDHCLAPNTLCDGTGCDNMTAIIVQFKDSKLEAGGAASSSASKKRSLDESSEAEESTKKLKTEDVSSTDSIGSSQLSSSSTTTANADGFLEKSSGSPDTTQ